VNFKTIFFMCWVDCLCKVPRGQSKGNTTKNKTKLVLAGLVSANFLKSGLYKNIQTDPRWNHNPVADLQHAINLVSPANTSSWYKNENLLRGGISVIL